MYKTIYLISFFLLSIASFGQVTVINSPPFPVDSIVQRMVGPGIEAFNSSKLCAEIAMGYFFGANDTEEGMHSGIVLTTGSAEQGISSFAPSGGYINVNNQAPDDEDLNNLDWTAFSSKDACVLEFDFIPHGNEVSLSYIYGSQEYPVIVFSSDGGSPDPMAIFIEGGEEYPEKTNIALVPNSILPVSVGTINDDSNEEYLSSGLINPDIRYNRSTVELQATAEVTPCQNYHLKIVIADGAGSNWDNDSGIFIREKSLKSNVPDLKRLSENTIAENCGEVTYEITPIFGTDNMPIYDFDNAGGEDYQLLLGGTAKLNEDYTISTNNIQFESNNPEELTISPLLNNLDEGNQYITIYTYVNCPNNVSIYSGLLEVDTIYLKEALQLNTSTAISLCEPNTSIPLFAEGADNFTWNPPVGLSCTDCPNPTANIQKDITYTVFGERVGCIEQRNISITIDEDFQNATITPSQTICNTETLTLQASGGVEYQWQAVSNDSSIEYLSCTDCPSPKFQASEELTGTIEYEVLIHSGPNCTHTLSTSITVIEPDIVLSAEYLNICIGETANISATGTGDFIWTNSNGGLINTGNELSVSPLETTDYQLIVLNNNCPNILKTITVEVEQFTAEYTTPSTFICEGEEIALTATNGIIYQWLDIEGNLLSNKQEFSVSPTTNTTYQLISTDGLCSDSLVIPITVEPIYDVSFITTAPQVCGEATSINLGVESIPSIDFNWEPAEYISEINEDGSIVTANPPSDEASFDYTVTPITTLGCSAPDTISVVISDSLNITVDAPKVLCTDLNNPELFSITAFGADTYIWEPLGVVIANPGAPEALIVPNPANNDLTFTVYGENTTGECVGEHTFQIEVIQAPTITIDVPIVCEQEQAQINTTIEGGTGNFDYQWFPTIGLDNPAIPNPTVRIEESTLYTLLVIDLDSGCETIQELFIEYNPTPEYNLTPLQSICTGESVTLSIQGADSSENITWTDDQGNTFSGNNIAVSPTLTTIYQATLNTPCTVELTTMVEVATPQININASETFVCKGESVELTATGAATFDWVNNDISDPSNPFQVVKPEETTTYFLAGYSADGICRDSTSITIEVETVDLLSPLSQQICGNGGVDFVSLEIDAGEMATYSWTPPIGLSTTDAALVIANPDETTLYTVEVTTAEGCQENINFLVEVFEAPAISISPSNVELCKNESQIFNLIGGVSYTISAKDNQDFQIDYLSSNVVEITAQTDLDLIIEGMDAEGCLATAEANVQVIDPILSHSNDTQICSGESTELSADGGVGATYNWSPVAFVSDRTVANPTVNPTENTIFSVEVTNAAGCTDTELILVGVSPPIEAELEVVEGENFCKGESRTLHIVSEQLEFYTFEWYNAQGEQIGGENEDSIVVNATETTTFTVVVSDANNCQKTEEITLQLEEINLVAQDVITCIGGVALMNVSGDSSGETIYEWQPAEWINCLNPECSSVKTVPFETEESIEFTITGTNENGCVGTTTAIATAAQALVLELSVSNPTLCAGESLELTIGGASDFTWEGEGLSAITGSSITINLETPGTYEYAVVGMAGDCEETLSFSVDVYEVPQILVQDFFICEGDAIALTADSDLELEYEWFDELGNEIVEEVIAPSETATYTVVGTSSDNCQSSEIFTIDVAPNPSISLNESYFACAEEPLSVEATTDVENGFFEWLPSTGVENENSPNTVISALESTTYTLTATNQVGCSSVAETFIEITEDCVFPGDANNDGQVDMFDLFPLGANFGESGFARNSISNEWRGFGVEDWAVAQSNGLNLKYVDCNGNGTIGFEDTTAILQNFDLLQKSQGFKKGGLGDPELRFSPLLTEVGVGESIEIEVRIGSLENPALDLYAIAFETNFDPNLIDPSSIVLDYSDSDLGTKNVDLLAVDLVNEETGRLNVSMSRIAPPGKSGELYLLTIRMRALAELEEVKDLAFTISDFGATNSDEETVLVNLLETPTVTIDPDVVAIDEAVWNDSKPYQLYPNFIHDRFRLYYELQRSASLKVSLFALSGQRVGVLLEEENAPMGKQEREVDLTSWNLAEGVYIVELRLEGKVFREKIVVW